MMDYNMQDKFLLKAELFTFSKMYAPAYQHSTDNNGLKVVTQVAEEIKGAVDLNLGVEYRYSKVLSGFINLNNILNQRYYKYYNYPSYRFNLMLGITYSF
jgi:outer membrane receptor protein involved in Fe transport